MLAVVQHVDTRAYILPESQFSSDHIALAIVHVHVCTSKHVCSLAFVLAAVQHVDTRVSHIHLRVQNH